MDYNFMTNDELIRHAYQLGGVDPTLGKVLLDRLIVLDEMLSLYVAAFGEFDEAELLEQANGWNT